MMQKEPNIQVIIPVKSLAESISEMVIMKINSKIPPVNESPIQEKRYLSRKQSYEKIGITGPTFDNFVDAKIIEKLGTGKRARFRYEDVDNIYENLNDFLYKRKNI